MPDQQEIVSRLRGLAALCAERAESYGALRRSATTAVVLDRVATELPALLDMVEKQREALEEASFLSDRLDEMTWGDGFDEFCNNYLGHVVPPHSRLKRRLSILRQTGEPT